MGIMALHIQQGSRPIFFYGQYYMGALQAYVAAFLLPFFGPTLFSLRLAIILFYVGFLVSMYILTRILYAKNFALFVVFLLCLGSNAVFSRQLSAIGGYSETIFFSALAFVLVAWLALSPPDGTTRNRLLRLCAYSAWGLTIGLGLWSDLLILPTVVCSGFLLWLFCWRELLKGSTVALLLGLVLGALPLIIYNLNAPHGLDSWSILMSQQGHVNHTAQTLIAQIKATTEYSIPAITSSPLCHHSEYQFIFYLGFQASHLPDHSCAIRGRMWSGAYLSLCALACIIVACSLFTVVQSRLQRSWTLQERRLLVRNAIRLGILVSTLLTLYLYTTSEAPLILPSILSRYLICVWVSTPVVIWPVWKGVTWVGKQPFFKAISWIALVERTFCLSALVCLCATLLYGTYVTLGETPAAVNADRTEHIAIDTLIKHKITHVYSGYWTCNRMAFESQERITCGVMNNDLTGPAPGLNRYAPYYTAVQNDPYTSYIFEQNTSYTPSAYEPIDVFRYSQASDLTNIEKKLARTGKIYQRLMIGNYTVYEPVP
jgi:hypothetical protein